MPPTERTLLRLLVNTRQTATIIRGFSLTEMLVVMGVVSLLLALSAPSFVSLSPIRKTALYEVKGFMEYARTEAVTRDREVYVAFANGSVPGDRAPYRTYAAFVATGPEGDGLLRSQEILQISEWKSLPEGTVFVSGSEFETVDGASLETVVDSSFTRSFELGGGRGSAELPFFLFSPSGRILVPSYFNANALHIGIAEGYFDRDTPFAPVITAKRPGIDSDREYAQAECLAVEYYSGRCRALTD